MDGASLASPESMHQIMTLLQEIRELAIAYAGQCSDDLRHLFALHPLLGEIDCYRFLLLLAAHPARHAVQIEEIKLDTAFPQS